MQDSIELPDSSVDSLNQLDIVQSNNLCEQQINFCISPNISAKKHVLVHNASESSLAYSTSTKMYGLNTQRSPLRFNIPNSDASNNKNGDYNRLLGKYAANDFSNIQCQDPIQQNTNGHNVVKKNKMKDSHIQIVNQRNSQDGRKTINKNNPKVNTLNRQKKQLQYALQLEMITSQQLRTKVQILTQLLEQNMKNSQLGYFLKLKNSSNMKNVDIFIQMKKNTRKLKEHQMVMDQQNIQIMKLKEQLIQANNKNNIRNNYSSNSISFNKQNMNMSNRQQDQNYDINKKIGMLQQQKQSLFIYVEELKTQFNEQINKNKLLAEQLQRRQEKQQIWVNKQRPKLCQQLTDKSQQIIQLNQQVQKLKMQINLIELTQQNNICKLKSEQNSIYKLNQYTQNQTQTDTYPNQVSKRCISVQAGSVTDYDVLTSQLDLLKNERDYYIGKYKSILGQLGNVHKLKLQLTTLKNQLSQLTTY